MSRVRRVRADLERAVDEARTQAERADREEALGTRADAELARLSDELASVRAADRRRDSDELKDLVALVLARSQGRAAPDTQPG